MAKSSFSLLKNHSMDELQSYLHCKDQGDEALHRHRRSLHLVWVVVSGSLVRETARRGYFKEESLMEDDVSDIALLSVASEALQLIDRNQSDACKVNHVLIPTIATLHSRLVYSGSFVPASHAASLLAFLDHNISSWVCTSAGGSLAEGGFYDTADEFIEFYLRTNEQRVSQYVSQDSENCAKLEINAVQSTLSIRSRTPPYFNEIQILKQTLSSALEMAAKTQVLRANKEKIDMSNKSNFIIFLEAQWVASTCHMAIAEAQDKSGNVKESLCFLRDCDKLCRDALNLSKRLSKSSTNYKHFSALSSPQNFVWRWKGRLAYSLQCTATCYSRLGDKRRAEGYSIAACEVLGMTNCSATNALMHHQDITKTSRQN